MVDIDPPYRLDPFQNIVNVHWGANNTEIWYTCFPDGAQLNVTSRDVSTFTSGEINPAGSICLVTDMNSQTPGFGNFGTDIRPGYGICDWTIPTPVHTTPFLYVSYSAGTLYKTVSEAAEAFANSRGPNYCTWNHRFVPGAGPPEDVGGPDTTPAQGALCPELNAAGSAWETYKESSLLGTLFRPIYHPNWRIFIVNDDEFETWMFGIHDEQERPDIDEHP